MPRKPPERKLPRLEIAALGPIKRASIDFGDLTVFVGPQASGKSILLQSLKLILDHAAITSNFFLHGLFWHKDNDAFLDLYFGEGMRNLWSKHTALRWDGRALKLDRLTREQRTSNFEEKVFYIPAHRALTLRNGWPRHFGDYVGRSQRVRHPCLERRRRLHRQRVDPRQAPWRAAARRPWPR